MLPLRGRFPEGVAISFSVTFSAKGLHTTLASVAVVPKSWDRVVFCDRVPKRLCMEGDFSAKNQSARQAAKHRSSRQSRSLVSRLALSGVSTHRGCVAQEGTTAPPARVHACKVHVAYRTSGYRARLWLRYLDRHLSQVELMFLHCLLSSRLCRWHRRPEMRQIYRTRTLALRTRRLSAVQHCKHVVT